MKCSYLTVYEGPPGTHYTCALFAPSASSKGDILYVGNNDGLLYYFVVSKNLLINRQDELNPGEVGGGNHKSSVTCLLHSKHPGLAGTSICEKGGLMFSGSKDRTVKIWQSAGTFKPLIQTLYGHTGQVSGLCDGCDGTVLSCSLDGTIRIWRPQRGRELMLKPFFECINVVAASKDTEVWLTCIAVNATNHWACFAANSQGDVTVFRKSKDGLFGSSIYATGEASVSTAAAASHFSVLGSTSTQPYLSTHEVWPRVHGLGISKIFVEEDTNLVVTLSFDGTSKILDASCGYAMFTLRNTHHCVYTGISWCAALSSFYLVDELGHVEVFNLFREKTVDVLSILPPTIRAIDRARKDGIVHAHRDPLCTAVCAFNQGPGTVLTLFPGGVEERPGVAPGSAVVAWRLTEDVTLSEYDGHDGAVIAVAVPPPPATVSASPLSSSSSSTSSSSSQQLQQTQTQTMSREEAHFFSLGQHDNTVRCWDEVDRSESFQLRLKERAEPTALCVLWPINMLAVGFEGGGTTLMNADSGSRIPSRALGETVSCLIEGQRFAPGAGKATLVGGDFSGAIAVWDITNGYNAASTVFQGFHSADDPSILSLAFHHPCTTVFSGGSDGTIRYWQMNNKVSSADYRVQTFTPGNDEGQVGGGGAPGGAHTADLEQQARALGVVYVPRQRQVTSLQCTDDFLLAGDESGELRLFLVVHAHTSFQDGIAASTGAVGHKDDVSTNRGVDPPPVRGLQLLVRWPTPTFSALSTASTTAVSSLFQASAHDCFVAQAREGGRTTVWQVNLKSLHAADAAGIGSGGETRRMSSFLSGEEAKLALLEEEAFIKGERAQAATDKFYAIDPRSYDAAVGAAGRGQVGRAGALLGSTSMSSRGSGGSGGGRGLLPPVAGAVAKRQTPDVAPPPAIATVAAAPPEAAAATAPVPQHSLLARIKAAAAAAATDSAIDTGHPTATERPPSSAHTTTKALTAGAGATAFSSTGKALAAVVADVVSSATVAHPDKEARSLTLTGTRRADAPPDVLFVATAQGHVLRFKLSISAARMGATTAAGVRSAVAKKQFKKLLVGAKSGVAALQRAAGRQERDLLADKPVFASSPKRASKKAVFVDAGGAGEEAAAAAAVAAAGSGTSLGVS